MHELDTLRIALRAGIGRFLLLYAALYGAYGALSPFLPSFLKDRGFSSQDIALLLGASFLVRLIAGPLAGRQADRSKAVRQVLIIALLLSAGLTYALYGGWAFSVLIVIGLALAAATAPLAPLADTLALAAAKGGSAFEYGWVRAAGSAAFIAATSLTGILIDAHGIATSLLLAAAGFGATAAFASRIPQAPGHISEGAVTDASTNTRAVTSSAEFRTLAASSEFRRLLLAAALVIGAHAMHDTFAVIAWRSAGLGAGIAGLLWSVSVAAEILVFLWAGPRLLERLGPARAIEVAALAGMIRWGIQGQTTWLPVLVGLQCLHGLTFALLHLACLAVIEKTVPQAIRASALTVYGSVGLGLATALLTLAAGPLYAALGLHAFWVMSLLSLMAVPVAASLRVEAG